VNGIIERWFFARESTFDLGAYLMDGPVKSVDGSVGEGGDGEGRLKTAESAGRSVTRSVEARWGRSELAAIGIAVLFGLAVWVIDAVLDYLIFYKGETFLGLLITDIRKHEVYNRTVLAANDKKAGGCVR